MSQFIPLKDLKKGSEIIVNNINSLVETATLLHRQGRYLHSATFSVLAMEEMAKLELVSKHCIAGKDLPLVEWNQLTGRGSAHKRKLVKHIMNGIKSTNKAPPGITMDQIVELIADYYQRVKLRVFYVNWERGSGTWQWLAQIYSEKEQEEVSERFLRSARAGQERLCKA